MCIHTYTHTNTHIHSIINDVALCVHQLSDVHTYIDTHAHTQTYTHTLTLTLSLMILPLVSISSVMLSTLCGGEFSIFIPTTPGAAGPADMRAIGIDCSSYVCMYICTYAEVHVCNIYSVNACMYMGDILILIPTTHGGAGPADMCAIGIDCSSYVCMYA
jgi:hypothetical protein